MHKYKKLLSQIFITKNLIVNRVKPSDKLRTSFYIAFFSEKLSQKIVLLLCYCLIFFSYTPPFL